MNAVVLALFLLARLILPFGILITLGEWIRRREANYWFHR